VSRIPQEVIDAVNARANGDCEACGKPLDSEGYDYHHRKLRSQGGKDEAVNLMLVHAGLRGRCHNLHQNSIHQNPNRSKDLGHIVPRWLDPAEVPVYLIGHEPEAEFDIEGDKADQLWDIAKEDVS
jgi:hypothetical protein